LAKKAFVYDGTNWIDIAQSTTDLSNYANMTTTPISGFRNVVINGGFDVWQRGTSFSGNSVYTADRWVSTTDTTTTWTRQSFTPGNAITEYEPTYFFRSVVSGGAYSVIEQRIEDVRTLAGQTVTLSFFAKANATKNLWVRLDQNFGTSGSTTVSYASLDVKSISSTWNRYTYTFLVPSISGKTVGANSYLSIQFWFTGGSSGTQTGTFDLWGVQLEKGTIATPFEQRPIGTEISLCQRYFCKSFPIDVAPANNLGTSPGGGNQLTTYTTTVGNAYASFQRYPVPMRKAPDMVGFNAENANAGTWSLYNSSGALNSSYTTSGAFSPQTTGFLASFAGVPTLTVSNGCWTANAEL
jgi:hypothetical protein